MSDKLVDLDDVDVDLQERGGLITSGVRSDVVDSEGDLVGHVSLLDLDDADPLAVSALSEQTPGVSAVFESSGGSYHMWDLRVRDDVDQMALDMLDVSLCDAEHVQQSRSRGYAVLRIGPKFRPDGDVYKPVPELLQIDLTPSEGDEPVSVSRGHLSLLMSISERDVPVETEINPKYIGSLSTVRVDDYLTLDDDAKARIRGGLK